jgi:DNA-binding transcriptional regulator YhcF (GntR family)
MLKYERVAAAIRAQIADGMLLPGQAAPSGDALARATGFSSFTCRKALRKLIKDGVLVPGHSRNGRPRVPGLPANSSERAATEAKRVLSASLAVRRRGAGLTQPQLADAIGVSITSVGHAETGRLWQARHFWERADKVLDADGELLELHDAYQAAAVRPDVSEAVPKDSPATADILNPVTVTRITITWSDGTITTIDPPNGADVCRSGMPKLVGTSRDGASRP